MIAFGTKTHESLNGFSLVSLSLCVLILRLSISINSHSFQRSPIVRPYSFPYHISSIIVPPQVGNHEVLLMRTLSHLGVSRSRCSPGSIHLRTCHNTKTLPCRRFHDGPWRWRNWHSRSITLDHHPSHLKHLTNCPQAGASTFPTP